MIYYLIISSVNSTFYYYCWDFPNHYNFNFQNKQLKTMVCYLVICIFLNYYFLVNFTKFAIKMHLSLFQIFSKNFQVHSYCQPPLFTIHQMILVYFINFFHNSWFLNWFFHKYWFYVVHHALFCTLNLINYYFYYYCYFRNYFNLYCFYMSLLPTLPILIINFYSLAGYNFIHILVILIIKSSFIKLNHCFLIAYHPHQTRNLQINQNLLNHYS